ncbi:MAG TPA: hypothetical protein VNZ67_00770, partial [bacterium]|nr:hypothetical protein [bacterium]
QDHAGESRGLTQGLGRVSVLGPNACEKFHKHSAIPLKSPNTLVKLHKNTKRTWVMPIIG